MADVQECYDVVSRDPELQCDYVIMEALRRHLIPVEVEDTAPGSPIRDDLMGKARRAILRAAERIGA